MTILAITSILILAPSMSSNAFATSHLTYADSVVNYVEGSGVNDPARDDPQNALDAEDSFRTTNFVSLGQGGSITLGFSEPVGGTLSVFEATFGAWPLESVDVEVSSDGVSWTNVGIATNDEGKQSPLVETQIDLVAQGIGCISFVKLTDTTSPSTGDNFDVDAVGITGGVECVVPPQECETVTFELIAGQNIDAGYISVTNDADNLTITITTQDGWSLSETHVSVQDSEDDIPQNKKGNPIPGHFEYSETHDPNVESYEIIIPLDDLPDNYGSLTIAVHAVVQQVENGEVVAEETAWGDGPRFVDKGNWAMYFEYEIQDDCGVVPPEEEDLIGQFRTQTQGGWGNAANGNNPGVYRDGNFTTAFPSGLVIGESNGYNATFTTSLAVQNFLPQGGNSAVFVGNYVDPTTTNAGVFAGQVTALSLSVGFDECSLAGDCAEFAPLEDDRDPSATALADLVVVDASYACEGMSVGDILDEANLAISGQSSSLDINQLNECVSSINENFVDGTNDEGFLGYP